MGLCSQVETERHRRQQKKIKIAAIISFDSPAERAQVEVLNRYLALPASDRCQKKQRCLDREIHA